MSGPGYAFLGEEEMANVMAAMAGTLTRYRYGLPGEPSFVYRFERHVEQLFGSAHCIATNSGTSALITALSALGVGPGDEVIVPAYTFIATIASIVLTGATPVLAEIDDTLNLDPVSVAGKITSRTRGIIAVHMLGAGADLARLGELARERGLFLIEDVAQACGGSQSGRRLGTFGEFGAFSLNYFKVITSGEGGFLLTADDRLFRRAYAFHDQGFAPLRDEAVDDDQIFGLNLRMPDLCGAVAHAQIQKIDHILGQARTVKAKLATAIGPLPDVTRRRLVDPAGDCALALVYIFPSPEYASEVSRLVGTKTLISSGRHYYGNMGQLATMEKPGGSRSLHRPDPESLRSYAPGALPATDSLLARSVALSVGSSDSYSATGFGVNVMSDDRDIQSVAAAFRAAVSTACGSAA